MSIFNNKNHSSAKLSPMMQQWFDCKKKSKNALLLFRLGDFYEAFNEDAYIISKELDLTLTKRHNIPMCGVPFHTLDTYVDKLIEKGFKVAIAEQIEKASSTTKLVKRDVVRIISPGTIINSNLLSDKKNNFFISISKDINLFGIAIIDLSTSDFKTIQVKTINELENEIFKIKPSEILISQTFYKENQNILKNISNIFNFLLNIKEDKYFDKDICINILKKHLSKFKIESSAAITAAGALLQYLEIDLYINLESINTLTNISDAYMQLDLSCLKNLEILDENTKNEATLLFTLDKTKTSMGGRLLSYWLKHPLTSIEEIKKRQNAIEELISNKKIYLNISEDLDYVKDMERLIIKINNNTASPRDLISLKKSIKTSLKIKETTSNLKSDLLKEINNLMFDLKNVSTLIENSIIDDPPFRLSEGKVIKENYNKELDDLYSISTNSKKWLALYQN